MKAANVKTALVLAVALIAAGCGQPLPVDKTDYVGLWASQTPDMTLQIFQEGRVEYLRKEGNTRSSIKAPIQGFFGNDFEVGLGFIKTRFVVSVPPHQEDGVWKMTVDGVVLTRAGDRTT